MRDDSDSMLKVERKTYKPARTPHRARSQAFSPRPWSTPKTPRFGSAQKSTRPFNGGQYSGKKETAELHAQVGYPVPGPGQQFPPPVVGAIPAPFNGQPVMGASGLPCMPMESPLPPSPFPAYNPYAIYWNGMTPPSYQEAGVTYYAYTPPHVMTQQNQIAETPTRAPGREQRHYPNGA